MLRLICLQTSANSGLKPRVLEHYKREIIHAYGFQHMATLHNLEACGLLRLQLSARPFTVMRRALNLVVEDVNEIQPTDISYVHSIYAPLSVRLIQNAAKPGWKSIADVLSLIPGNLIQETQPLPISLKRKASENIFYLPVNTSMNLGSLGSRINSSMDDTKVTLVLFLGGCTYSEVSALRFLTKMEDGTYKSCAIHCYFQPSHWFFFSSY